MITYANQLSLEDYTSLRATAGWPEIPRDQAQTGLLGSAFIVSAMDGERTVGMARLVSDGGYFYLVADVVVHPDYQGQGIGRELMRRATAHIEGRMQPGHGNYTLLNAAVGKEPFYEKLGFARLPDEKHGAGMLLKIKLES